ncbi:MAG: hypothetical protein ACOYOS_17645 [Syntrophales bacterium]
MKMSKKSFQNDITPQLSPITATKNYEKKGRPCSFKEYPARVLISSGKSFANATAFHDPMSTGT